jgi:hypothetical protein
MQIRTRAAGIALVIMAVAGLAGCGSKNDAAAAASSFTANPTVAADITRAENELNANFQKDFSVAHPLRSFEQAIADTFPGGSVSQITTYAAHHFTPAAAHKGAARQELIQGTVEYALSLGAPPSATASGTASASPGGKGNPAPPASPSPAATASPAASATGTAG